MERFGFYISHGIVLGFLVGVACASLTTLPLGVIFFLSVVTLSFGAAFFLISDKSPPIQVVIIVTVSLLCCFLGIIRYSFFRRGEADPYLDTYVDKKVTLKGIISEEPSQTDDAQRSVMTILEGNDKPIQVNTRILIKSDFYPKLHYGDEVTVIGNIKKPESFETETGRVFNYPAFLARQKIFYTMSFARITITDSHKGSKVIETLLSVKHSFMRQIKSVIPQPESNLLGGYLVEGKGSLSSALQEEFKIAGIIHTVALSGYNVTIIVQAVMAVLGFLPKAGQLSGGVIAIVLFVFMTGASANVVRAAVMGLVTILAQSLGRTYNVARSLTLTAFVMVVWNPMTLMFDPGFQLSFLATMGLIYISPIIAPYMKWIPEKLKLRETIGSSLAAQLTVLPFLLYSSGQLSIVALPINILMLPGIPLTMLLGAITAGLSFISEIVAMPIGWLAYLLLHLQLAMVHFFANLPYAAVQVPFPLWLTIIIYVLTCLWLLYSSLRSRPS
jgi:competence protein ComEC